MGNRGFVICPGVAHDRPGMLEQLKSQTLESLLRVVDEDQGGEYVPTAGSVGWRIVRGSGAECRRVLDSYLNEHSQLTVAHQAEVDQMNAFFTAHPERCLLVIAITKAA